MLRTPAPSSLFLHRRRTVSERRTWDSPVREPWNPIIHHLLKAVDTHNRLYFQTCDEWHLQKAREMRAYVVELKNWIKNQE
jgi:hypothetical protein